MILNRAKDYYENDKERSREQARNMGRIDIAIMSEEKKQTLKEYQKN